MDNREKLMQCALQLFCARGYDAVGVQEIVERTGVTKPTLYYYFGSKKGLLEAVLDEHMGRLLELIREASRGEADIRSRLYGLADAYCIFFEQEQEFHLLMTALFYAGRESEAVRAAGSRLEDFFRAVVGIFEAEADSLGNMNGRQEQFAMTYIGILNHYLIFSLHRGMSPDERRAGAAAVVNQYLHGIFS